MKDIKVPKGYLRMNDVITIKCHIHGPFQQRAGDHIRGAGCPYCEEDLDQYALSIEDFIKYSNKAHKRKNKIKFIGVDDDVLFMCEEHGPYEERIGNVFGD